MEVKVTGCHDCPFRDLNLYCVQLSQYVFQYTGSGYPPYCPLKQDSITVKINDNDKTGNRK